MTDNTSNPEAAEKDRRRRKQFKRMGKILATVWDWDVAFQDREDGVDDSSTVLCLTDVGQKLDQQAYRLGRHGWEDFSRDLSGVYHRHIQGKTKKASYAKKCLEKVKEILGKIDTSLAKVAEEYVPPQNGSKDNLSASSKKRKAEGSSTTTPGSPSRKKKKTVNKNSELAQREDRALEMLASFVEERGGQRSQVANYSARVTRKSSGGKFDTNFFNEAGRRFRSMLEVGRFLGLVNDGGRGGGGDRVRRKNASRKATSREQEAEKKKLRKELERLRKAHQRASKALDDFTTEEKETRYPVDDMVLMEENSLPGSSLVTPTTCAAARIPDIEGFSGVPDNCIPDLLMTWDFLCTFERALSISPIGLDDFIDALVYVPPEGQMGDDILAPPVYLAEAHLGLLKLLFQDRSSDDWWWSTLETDDAEAVREGDFDEEEKADEMKPPIKIDLVSVFTETEDPLITTSWLRALDNARNLPLSSGKDIKTAVKAAMKVSSNKWVLAYLKKALRSSKVHGIEFTRRAALWLVDRTKDARPDLFGSNSGAEEVFKARKKVVEDAAKLMEELPDSVPSVADEDLSDTEYEDDDDDEDSDEDSDEEDNGTPIAKKGHTNSGDESQRVASAIPPKPLPSLVDMLLPPSKPNQNDDFVNAFTWPHLVGATVSRTLHRRKRRLNELDDSLRDANQLRPLTISERRDREEKTVSRILTECIENVETASLVEKAIEHLCHGGSYIQLSVVQRLCILRLLIEAAYDSSRLHDVVSDNYKQRMSALKALEVEQRRAKREAKEKAAADETAAREQLATEAREKFLDEKRDEIIALNEKSKEFSDEVMESLTYEDIIDFDDDIKADYEALPGQESFNKTEVNEMVARLQQESAFDTDALRVISVDELVEREKRALEEMEGQLVGFGSEDALLDPSLDRETVRTIEKLQRDVAKAKTQAEKLPELRQGALEQLKDAMADGTIKVLRSAMTAAKKAKLTGPDDETGGAFAVDLLRDAALELEKAKQNKRVFDAQKDLIAKTNKCFIRLDPLGQDRYRNRFWAFTPNDGGGIWTESEYSLKSDTSEPAPQPPSGFSDLCRNGSSIIVGTEDMEVDFIGSGDNPDARTFTRQEHHPSGFSSALAKQHWGCHATEESLRAVIKLLDSRGLRENSLKAKLKDALEDLVESDEKQEGNKEEPAEDDEAVEEEIDKLQTSGDENVFLEAKRTALAAEESAVAELEGLSTAIGSHVRLRLIISGSKDSPISRYENGSVMSWKIRREKIQVLEEDQMQDGDENDDEPREKRTTITEVPVWRVQTLRGKTVWCDGTEIVESIARYSKWKANQGYFESDAAFFAYRNSLGRHCGRGVDAPYASSPIFLARLMVKREGDLYPKLKIRCYDNNWGGKSGSRALWTNSMKDYAYDFQTVRQGLLTLEGAFFELTGEFSEYQNAAEVSGDIQAILDDPVQRIEIELESIEKNVPGLWNSPLSRAVFIHIVSHCSTTGFLALSLDLLCRNTMKYLQRHKLLNARTEQSTGSYSTLSGRTTRRMNAWQQQQQQSIYQDW